MSSLRRIGPSGGKPLYDIKIVNAEKARGDRKIAGMCGLSLYCHADFRSFRGEIDTLLVPGGIGVEEREPEAAAIAVVAAGGN